MGRFKKNESIITDEEIIIPLKQMGTSTSAAIAKRINKNHITISRKMELMVSDKKISKIQYNPNPNKKYTIRLYKIETENDKPIGT